MLKYLLVLFFVLCSQNVFAQSVEFVGKPQIISSFFKKNSLSSSEQEENRVVIMKEHERYFWTTRNNTELTKNTAGAVTTYVAINGAGMVVITTQPDMLGLCQKDGVCYNYAEHIRTGINIISYYGVAQ